MEEILGAQRPRSDEHDEILFIVVHQVYELWFKQLIHELRYLQRMLEEGNDARAFATFKRVLTILKLVVAQLDVIETMTPVQFLEFRDQLKRRRPGSSPGSSVSSRRFSGGETRASSMHTTKAASTTTGSRRRWRGRPSTTRSFTIWTRGVTTSPRRSSSGT